MTEPPPIQPEPNVLRDAAAPNVLWSSVPGGPPPGGEQVSWVSGTTRILVSLIQDDAPPDHAKIEALAALVPQG